MSKPVTFFAVVASVITGCSSYYDEELEAVGRKSDFSGISSYDLCDAAAYFYYDAPSGDKAVGRRLLSEVLRRGDISKAEFNSALTGDLELGMSDLAATCAWGLPSEETEYYISRGRKYSKWTYRYDDYSTSTVELINDRVVALDT